MSSCTSFGIRIQDTCYPFSHLCAHSGNKPVAIARAVIMQPSLLILDEATSSLDSCSEIAVQEALDQLMRMHENNTTVVVIAHRLRTVRNADKIVVLEGGKVVEEGTHDELFLRSKGVYRKMVEQAEATGFLPES